MLRTSQHRWALKLLPVPEKAFRCHKHAVGRSWRMDESVFVHRYANH